MKMHSVTGMGLLVAIVVGWGVAQAGTISVVPDNLKAPENEILSLEAQASGVQIYECKAGKAGPTRFEWTFKAPEADLLDRAGKKIGKHYAGPTWESADGSKVVGEIKARDNGPDPGAIPWLLLTAKSTSGKGVFSQTTSIQRLNTSGGKAPAEGCNESKVGEEIRVPYKAMYYFYAPKP